jgi:hypothetical protein
MCVVDGMGSCAWWEMLHLCSVRTLKDDLCDDAGPCRNPCFRPRLLAKALTWSLTVTALWMCVSPPGACALRWAPVVDVPLCSVHPPAPSTQSHPAHAGHRFTTQLSTLRHPTPCAVPGPTRGVCNLRCPCPAPPPHTRRCARSCV